MQETWVQSLSQEDTLEKGMATHSSILVWRIPMDRGAWYATVHGGCKESDMIEHKPTFFFQMIKAHWSFRRSLNARDHTFKQFQ